MHLSRAANRLEGQQMFQILAEANELEKSGRDIIHLEIGDPDFDTPHNIVKACVKALEDGNTHYVPSAGLEELRRVSASRTLGSRGFRPDIGQILVTPGANVQIYYAMACAIDPGEDVIVIDPAFVSYSSIAKLLGINAVKVSLHEKNEFRVDPRDIRKALTKKTRMIIINSPHNPTGAVMREEEIKEIYDIAQQNGIYLFSDEVYARMIYQDAETRFYSPSKYDRCEHTTVVAHSLSKSYAMTGWRIGAVTAPTPLVEKMALALETTSSCVSPFIQLAALEALQGSQEPIARMVQKLRDRRDVLLASIQDIPGLSCVPPKGAFYAFLNIKDTNMDSRSFASSLLEDAGVATCPGVFFGDAGEGYIRICFARPTEEIREAMTRMKNWLNGLKRL